MTRANIEEITRDPARWIRTARDGETVVITEEDIPVAEMRPVVKQPTGPRPFGLAAGKVIVPDSFFDPLPDDILDAFEGR
jgi:antitoxin (DNA-binding transcriptional repressor) of toxin-antitoxin stability system